MVIVNSMILRGLLSLKNSMCVCVCAWTEGNETAEQGSLLMKCA